MAATCIDSDPYIRCCYWLPLLQLQQHEVVCYTAQRFPLQHDIHVDIV